MTIEECRLNNLGFKNPMFGKNQTEETREKQRLANTGRKLSKATKEKLRLAKQGENHWNFGKQLSRKTIEKIRLTNLTLEAKERNRLNMLGSKNPNYIDGKSNDGYPIEFNEELKRKIRKKYNSICQKCGKPNSKHVHHIDYVKENCSEENLTCLCLVCNVKVNYNRTYWTQHFNSVSLALV